MRPDQRVVTEIPLAELWDASGPVPARRGPRLGDPDIRALLRGAGLVQFVVADAVGAPLRWIPPAETRAFWRYWPLRSGRTPALWSLVNDDPKFVLPRRIPTWALVL